MAGEAMREDEAVIRRAYRAFATRDVDALAELSSEDVEISTMTGLLAGRSEPYRGRTGLERTLVFGRVRAWHQRGLLDSSNAWLWTLRDGQVTAVRVFADPADARQLMVSGD